MIRDRIVVGVRDDTLSNELQAKANLTLDLAKQIARQAEARAENQPIIRGETVVNAVHRSKPHFQTTKGTHRSLQSKLSDQRNVHKCGYCGKKPHPKHSSAECTFCKKKGHYKLTTMTQKKKTSWDRFSRLTMSTSAAGQQM